MTEPIRPEDLRASDVDRKTTQERLHWAHAEGLISLAEFDNRVRSAWQATTRGELSKVTADLPMPTAPQPAPRGPFSATGGGKAMRVLFTVWLCISMANLVTWGLLTLSLDDEVYPWWIWVTAPPGAVLITLWSLGIGRRRRSPG